MSSKIDANDVARDLGPDGLGEELERLTAEAPSAVGPGGCLGPMRVGGDAPLLPCYRTARELMNEHPELRPPVIEGLLREGETINVIAPPKHRKSWLVLDMAMAVACGRHWLKFPTVQGRVLLLDNELHGETLAARLPLVAAARGIALDEVADAVCIETLRGRLADIERLRPYFDAMGHGDFKVIVLDAFYRFLPPGTDENDNAGMAAIYSQIDYHAQRLGCAFACVHHTTKGSQAGKMITDVGAGAGAQSRATDTHLILRPHKEEDVVVLEAAVRSWPPVEPVCLRWRYPVWEPAPGLDPADLRPQWPQRGKRPGKGEPPGPKEPKWTPEVFTERFITAQPKGRAAILCEAEAAGLSENKAKTFLKAAVTSGFAHCWNFGGNVERQFATVPQPRE